MRLTICLSALCLLVAAAAHADEPAPEPDLLTFASGVVPVAVEGACVDIGTGFEQAISVIDGNPLGFGLHRRQAAPDTDCVFVYAMPSPTTFSSFTIPSVFETPSPSQTFAARIEISGSSVSATDGFRELASAALSVHASPDERTTLAPIEVAPVSWLRVRLVGGIEEGAVFYEFSELIGHGRRDAVARVDDFTGLWDMPGGTLELYQDGAVVHGCADNGRKTVEGTVTGNLLRATLTDTTSGVRGAFILSATPDAGMRGVRSDNGAPFRMYEGPTEPEGTAPRCGPAAEETLGCGSVLHGITFAWDSAVILPESEAVLASLYAGLSTESDVAISVVGHTSSEGSDEYNQDLSQRRAQAVADALVALGLDPGALSATGRGEAEPIADNATETGRSMNRRVEIICAGGTEAP